MCLFKSKLKYDIYKDEKIFYISLIKNGRSLGGLRSTLYPKKKEIFINDIYIRDKNKAYNNYLKYINNGYGTYMMNKLISFAKENGYIRIIGNLSSVDENDNMDYSHRDRQIHFYKKFNFKILPNDKNPQRIELNLLDTCLTNNYKKIGKIEFIDKPVDVDKVLRDFDNRNITKTEFNNIKEESIQSCKMSVLAENNVVLYRVAKSSEDIANKAHEMHSFIHHVENSIVEDLNNINGLSLTTKDCLLGCLIYGDLVVEVPFTMEILSQYDMLNCDVKHVAGGLNEYKANKIFISKIFSLSNPETLKMIIENTDNRILRYTLEMPENDDKNLKNVFFRFKLVETANYWNNIVKEYKKLNLEDGDSLIELKKILSDIL